MTYELSDDEEYEKEMVIYQEQLAEEKRLEVLFGKALSHLFNECPYWQQNRDRYLRWNRDQRIVWIYYIQEQAEQGLPMAQQLMAKALAIRMAS